MDALLYLYGMAIDPHDLAVDTSSIMWFCTTYGWSTPGRIKRMMDFTISF